jgi:hypothetical protein
MQQALLHAKIDFKDECQSVIEFLFHITHKLRRSGERLLLRRMIHGCHELSANCPNRNVKAD